MNELENIINSHKENILISIPWIVLQELDKLKTRTQTNNHNNIGHKSQKAIIFLNDILLNNRTNFIFENSTQVIIFFTFFFNNNFQEIKNFLFKERKQFN